MQYPVLNRYVADFFIPEHNVIIEADGEYWHSKPEAIEHDKRRDLELKAAGYTVIRLKEKDLNISGPELVSSEIYKFHKVNCYNELV